MHYKAFVNPRQTLYIFLYKYYAHSEVAIRKFFGVILKPLGIKEILILL